MKQSKKKIYFGRPISSYKNLKLSIFLKKIIQDRFFGYEIIDPGVEEHINNAKKWKEKTGCAMDYFLEKLLPQCNIGIFLLFRDGALGAGVCKEIMFLLAKKLPVYIIDQNGQIERIDNIDKFEVLSIEETIKRIRDEDGNTIPYKKPFGVIFISKNKTIII